MGKTFYLASTAHWAAGTLTEVPRSGHEAGSTEQLLSQELREAREKISYLEKVAQQATTRAEEAKETALQSDEALRQFLNFRDSTALVAGDEFVPPHSVADIAPVDDSAPSMVLSSETIEVFDPYSLPACVTAICVQDFRITEPPGQLVIDEDAAASPMSGDDVYEDAVASPLSGNDVTMFQCEGNLDVDIETNLRPRAFGDSQNPVQHLTTFQDPGQI